MLRLTGEDRAVAEVAAVAEHVASLTVAATGLGIGRGAGPLVPLLDEAGAPQSAATLGEIRAWSQACLADDGIPEFWRALAHHPRLLAATWRKERVAMASGVIDEVVKTYAALAVAQFRQSAYWIDHYTRVLRAQAKVDDHLLVEIAGAVMHYVSFNTIAHGMRLDAPFAHLTASDFVPGGPLEHHVPGVKKSSK
ncbi:hypothetical protein [Hydrogenophaga sp.]|uniref:hypothetical protein n=1 Tax=Hydrogenophaga sp. TaxID=1904254 RepID=UPI003D1334FF